MALTFCSFASSSSGNCYLIKSGAAALLVDAGLSWRRTQDSLKQSGTSIGDLKAVLVTHEHSDHVRCLKVLAGKLPHAHVYASAGTWSGAGDLVPEKQRATFETAKKFIIGDIEAMPFPLSHDAAEPAGFSFCSGGKQISVLTDTGVVNDDIYNAIKDADLLVLEANHDVEMLRMGRYPWPIKQRILGEKGHLSNAAAAEVICKVVLERPKERHVLLAHLSKENNFPEMAYQTVKNLLEEQGCRIDRDVCIDIIERDKMSGLYTV
ncbi:MAG: MBL fold metallo-hydrolase [Clostridiales bacterium]|nr:MBL fold metallo-hydrolase [Clostridiales bacterium]